MPRFFCLQFVYTIILITFKVFIIDSPIIAFISAIAICGGCLLTTNKLKTWKFSLTYSLFVTCLMEYSHFLIFRLFSITRKALGVAEVTSAQPERLLISRTIVLLVYDIAILLIYKFAHIDVKSVCKLSNYRIFPIFLSFALGIIIYLKYNIKYTHSNEFHDILSVIFVFFIAMFLAFIFCSETFLKSIDKFQSKKINPAIEEAKSQKGKGYAGMIFISKELNFQMKFFQNELNIIGIDIEDKKAKQLAHCNALVNQEENPEKINMISDIYFYTGEIIGLQPKSVEANISNLLKNHWSSRDPKVLKKIKNNYHGPISEENRAPTPRQFLLYLVEKYREDNKVNASNTEITLSFFKKCFLDI